MDVDSILEAQPTAAELKNFSYGEMFAKIGCFLAGALLVGVAWIVTAQIENESEAYAAFRASIGDEQTVLATKGQRLDIPDVHLLYDGIGRYYGGRSDRYGQPAILLRAGLPNGVQQPLVSEGIPGSFDEMWGDFNLFTELGIPYRLRVVRAGQEKMEYIVTPYQSE